MCHRYFFFARTFSYLFFYHYLCTDLAYPEGRALVKNINGLCPKGHERTFSKRYLQPTQLRKLDQPEDIATKRLRWVYYIRMSSALRLMHISYNTQWRGLAKLLISVGGQCEGLVGGISKEVSPTSFLFHTLLYYNR